LKSPSQFHTTEWFLALVVVVEAGVVLGVVVNSAVDDPPSPGL
jgi:hypothetical protein